MLKRRISTFLSVALAGLFLGLPGARAELILNFGQTSNSNTLTATTNGVQAANGGTQLSAVGVEVFITQIGAPLTTPITAYLNLSASSVTDVSGSISHLEQDFDGTFSITKNANGTGTDYLSGSFVGGANTGPSGATVFGSGSSLTLSASSPNGIPFFQSDVISTLVPTAISMGFSNVTPAATETTDGTQTLAGFTAGISGNFSAVPEPASVIMLGIGVSVVGFASVRRRARRVA